ncbi:hypothetical protein V6N13_104562 [Hibiscus sabdariffa]
MDSTAQKWFHWMQRQCQLIGWNHLVEAIRNRFAITEIESPEGQLSKLVQTLTVDDYQTRFEDLALRTNHLSEDFLTQCFVSGLRSDIKHEVLGHRSTSMTKVSALARFYEAKVLDKRQLGRSFGTKLPSLLPTPHLSHLGLKLQPGRPPPPIENSPGSSSSIPPRRISTAEYQARRDKGLCYYCSEEILDSSPPMPISLTQDESTDLGNEHSLVSFNALAGYSSRRTIRVIDKVQGHILRILIDGGSAHNFIQSRVSKHLGLPITPTPNFKVMVGNGDKLQNEGCVRDLQVQIQGTNICADFYVLPLEGTEMVLGVAWMATLGPITMNFCTLQFQFHQGEHIHCWQGSSENILEPIQFHSFRRISGSKAIAECYYLNFQSELPIESTVVQPELVAILSEFAPVFEAPQGLPPTRTHDHAIHLEPQAKQVNVRPYRYPYFQKSEVERQVQHMLNHHLIRRSTSPFSSSVLLVKKKDGT